MGSTRWRALALAAAGVMALAACGGSAGQQTGSLAADQTLRFPILDDFGTLDPGQLNAETDSEIAQNVFNGLVKYDQNLKVVPDIASSMPTISPDGLTYNFKLRQDVTFSNGDKVTAKDVLYSWNRAASLQGPYGSNLSAIEGYDKLSPKPPAADVLEQLLEKNDPSVTMSGLTAPDGPQGYTVQVKLASPAGWFLPAIALESTSGMLVDENAVKKDPMNWWTKPETLIGTGSYKMTARTPGQSVDFEAVPTWWGSPKPTVTKVHLDIIKDPETAITAYEQGKYDLYGYGGYSNIPVGDVLRIKNSGAESQQLLLHPKVRTYWVSFNTSSSGKRQAKGPFTSDQPNAKDLRMAFGLAVDKDKLVNVVCHNLVCTPATGGLITKGLQGYLGDNADPLAKFDAAKAKQLLQSADPDGSKTKGLTYTYDPENPLNGATAQFLQDQWQTNLGVHVDIKPESHSQFIKDRLVGDFVMSRDGWQDDYDHPQDWFDNNFDKTAGCPDSNCSTGYVNPQLDALAAQANAKPLDQALPDYKKMGTMLSDDAIYIPLYYSVGAFLIKPYVQNAGTNNFFDYYWNQISILQH
jgi:ABC-type oligopeptide transport system substrate-binding subunit